SVYCLIAFLERRWGVHFPVGGTGRLVRGLVGLIEGQGGSVQCNSGVSEILVEGGAACGVRVDSGHTLGDDIVVCNADSANPYRRLLPARHR
ncbi:phytoene desaturase, partial [Acinetobacter baumannii]